MNPEEQELYVQGSTSDLMKKLATNAMNMCQISERLKKPEYKPMNEADIICLFVDREIPITYDTSIEIKLQNSLTKINLLFGAFYNHVDKMRVTSAELSNRLKN
ncbi:MAG: hypothetical protein ABIC91_08105 [Nanoarchaeota archaeon]|nr:hypothetical protein [Nanoarchaeota archaeon]MBU1031049.1 hypothetical protein [Nanoarchaeota archaeon]MBU1850097.1 hypothetical protein [Nanoarchaeota archaeon]